MSPTELAWLAGLLEGEGTFHLASPEAGKGIRVRMVSTDLDVIESALRVTGMGHIGGPRGPYERGRRPYYTWDVTKGSHAYGLMMMLWPWLHHRRRQEVERCARWWIARPLRGKGQTHCKHGHEFTDENTYLRPNGSRACKACVRIRKRMKGRTHVHDIPT